MAKTDIQDAFRIIPIHPEDYNLLGFSWDNRFYYDKCLFMGASSSCQIFEYLSNSLQLAMYEKFAAAGILICSIISFLLGKKLPYMPCQADLDRFITLILYNFSPLPSILTSKS